MTSARICFVSVIGMFEYMLVMSSDVKAKYGSIGVYFRFRISSVVFFMLKECSSGVNLLNFCVTNLDNL
jgi:hypothetical protein